MSYLKNGVHSGQLAVHGDAEDFGHQVCAQEVSDGLVDVEVTGAHPDFGQKPVIFCIGRKENGVFVSWDLVELVHRREKIRSVFHPRPELQESLAAEEIPENCGFLKQRLLNHGRIMGEGRWPRVCVPIPATSLTTCGTLETC